MKQRPCELCNGGAALFCPSDAAFLCWGCDARVHDANFLVARHVRQPLCSNCHSFTGRGVSGSALNQFPATCPSCPPPSADADGDGALESLSSTSGSSACVSSTTSPANEYSGGSRVALRRRTEYSKAEGIFVNWCGKLGVGASIRTARRALSVCLDRWTALPFRVSLAASMWLGLRLGGDRSVLTWQVLKRLEEVSGVPAKVILAAESKLERALRGARLQQHRRRLELEEGWAEC